MSTKKDEMYRTACRRITELEAKNTTLKADADRLAECLQDYYDWDVGGQDVSIRMPAHAALAAHEANNAY